MEVAWWFLHRLWAAMQKTTESGLVRSVKKETPNAFGLVTKIGKRMTLDAIR
jgi:hypothetical protein